MNLTLLAIFSSGLQHLHVSFQEKGSFILFNMFYPSILCLHCEVPVQSKHRLCLLAVACMY